MDGDKEGWNRCSVAYGKFSRTRHIQYGTLCNYNLNCKKKPCIDMIFSAFRILYCTYSVYMFYKNDRIAPWLFYGIYLYCDRLEPLAGKGRERESEREKRRIRRRRGER